MINNYKIMFQCNGEKLILAANPEKLEVSQSSTNEVTEIINIGQVNVHGKAALQEMDFDEIPCYSVGGEKGIAVSLTLQKFQKSGLPIQIYVTSNLSQFISGAGSGLWLMESMSVEERVGEENDFYLTAKFKQYRNYSVKSYTVSNGKQTTAREPIRVDPKPVPITHQVRPGDNLWTLAKIYLGDSNRWQEIFALNRATLTNASLLSIGMQLRLPKK